LTSDLSSAAPGSLNVNLLLLPRIKYYSPTLRHISFLLILPPGFLVGSAVSQLKLQGAALARSFLREDGLEPPLEVVQKAALERESLLSTRYRGVDIATGTRL